MRAVQRSSSCSRLQLVTRCCRVPRQQHRAARRAIGKSHRLPVVATSEFWWEDEQEFDALTEVLLPKQVVICTPPAGQQGLQHLQPIKLVAAFCSPAAKQEAEQLWQQLGRAGPPLFLKVRVRDSLQELEQASTSSSAAAAAEQFWGELTGQSWRMDLDYGLNKDATLQSLAEPLLVVVNSSTGLQQLVAAAVGPSSSDTSSSSDDGVCVVEFTGWNQGEKQQQLKSWQQLQPQLSQLPEGASL